MAIGYPLGIGVTGDTVNTNYTGIIMLKGDKDALVDGDMRMVWAEGMATVQQYDLGAWRDGVLQAKEVMSGLGNLLLGGQHTISSGAESIFFKKYDYESLLPDDLNRNTRPEFTRASRTRWNNTCLC